MAPPPDYRKRCFVQFVGGPLNNTQQTLEIPEHYFYQRYQISVGDWLWTETGGKQHVETYWLLPIDPKRINLNFTTDFTDDLVVIAIFQ